MGIPDGYGLIAGRSQATAQAALAAAEAAGVDAAEVRTTQGGYIVPDAVLDAYSAAAGGKTTGAAAVPVPAAGGEHANAGPDYFPTSDWKNADIRDWADAHDVDLDGATTKADMLAAIDATSSA